MSSTAYCRLYACHVLVCAGRFTEDPGQTEQSCGQGQLHGTELDDASAATTTINARRLDAVLSLPCHSLAMHESDGFTTLLSLEGMDTVSQTRANVAARPGKTTCQNFELTLNVLTVL